MVGGRLRRRSKRKPASMLSRHSWSNDGANQRRRRTDRRREPFVRRRFGMRFELALRPLNGRGLGFFRLRLQLLFALSGFRGRGRVIVGQQIEVHAVGGADGLQFLWPKWSL